ncbi:MAG: hypothetical protein LBU99_00285 [Spirochaetaceae bacterium]|nr:hypothetical protein [Spirochaetaceae bacterium]
MTESTYRTVVQEMLNQELAAFEAMTPEEQAEIMEDLLLEGYSSASEYLNAMGDEMVNEFFADRACAYSFSADETALFLAQSLPANKGTNELAGQTYSDSGTGTYVFTADTYTTTSGLTETGSYSYDSIEEYVYLRPETVDGKTRAETYAVIAPNSDHTYADDNTARAADTNSLFSISYHSYDSTNKTVGW